MKDLNKNAAMVIAYHKRTKHCFDGYAKGLETIDRVERHQLELHCRYHDTESLSGPLLLLCFSSMH